LGAMSAQKVKINAEMMYLGPIGSYSTSGFFRLFHIRFLTP
jgi:hypothetical protein